MWIKAIHIILASLVYFSSIGVTLNKHFCKGELKNVALIQKAKSCDSSQCEWKDHFLNLNLPLDEPKSCCTDPGLDKEDNHQKDCCNEESEYIQVEVVNTYTDGINLYSVAAPIVYFIISSLDTEWTDYPTGAQWSFLHFHPPALYRDLPVLLQTFLI